MDEFEKEMEALLSVYRFRAAPPDFSRVAPLRRRRRWPYYAAAAAVIVAIIAAFDVRLRPRADEWRAIEVAGRATVPNRALRVGDVVRTGGGSRVRLSSRAVGTIDVGASTSLRLVESRKGRQRLELAAGTIHARTTSPPGVFVIDTPGARAIDLGCEYILTVSPRGDGSLRVLSGWVMLRRGWPQSLVPQGAAAAMSEDGRLSAPWFEDAPPAMQRAVRAYSFGSHGDLAAILALARRRDALTLLNLFSRATADERLLIYDRLNALVPAPSSITRESMRNWEPDTTEHWWPSVLEASGVHAIKKKKGMLRGL